MHYTYNKYEIRGLLCKKYSVQLLNAKIYLIKLNRFVPGRTRISKLRLADENAIFFILQLPYCILLRYSKKAFDWLIATFVDLIWEFHVM